MAAAPHIIQVYASLPRNVAVGDDLNLDLSNWHWVHCLTLPLDTLNTLQFSLKWIRYAIGVVVGAEGVLSTSADPNNAVDNNMVLPSASADLYYHISDQEKQGMFSVDPRIECACITSGVHTDRRRWRQEFRNEVAEREGNLCILSGYCGDRGICEAVHLVPYCKGDEYTSTYTQRRSRDLARGDVIHNIDNVRNGLFLNRCSHLVLGNDLAFLVTPNFAMNTTDIDPAASPAEKRYTSHFFPQNERIPEPFVSHGAQLRVSDMSFPPAILFDAVYASAVLHQFGTRTLKDDIAAFWKDTFYSGGIAATEEKENQKEGRGGLRPLGKPDTFDMLMILPYLMVPRNELQAMLK